jgi:hypothetical protein
LKALLKKNPISSVIVIVLLLTTFMVTVNGMQDRQETRGIAQNNQPVPYNQLTQEQKDSLKQNNQELYQQYQSTNQSQTCITTCIDRFKNYTGGMAQSPEAYYQQQCGGTEQPQQHQARSTTAPPPINNPASVLPSL